MKQFQDFLQSLVKLIEDLDIPVLVLLAVQLLELCCQFYELKHRLILFPYLFGDSSVVILFFELDGRTIHDYPILSQDSYHHLLQKGEIPQLKSTFDRPNYLIKMPQLLFEVLLIRLLLIFRYRAFSSPKAYIIICFTSVKSHLEVIYLLLLLRVVR